MRKDSQGRAHDLLKAPLPTPSQTSLTAQSYLRTSCLPLTSHSQLLPY